MNTKKIIADFYHTLTLGIIAVAFIIYLSFYTHFTGVLTFVRNIAPPIIFVAGMILIFSHDWQIINRRKMKSEVEEIIYITYLDALINDLLAFGTAILILAIPLVLFRRNLDRIDILQAIVAFLAIYWLRGHYFGKVGR